jgi:hypothetical protein
MTTQEALDLYKTQQELAEALGIKQSAVSMWGKYPPPMRQLQLERLTRGRLKAESDIFSKKRTAA